MPNIIMLALFAEVLCQNSSSEDMLWWEQTYRHVIGDQDSYAILDTPIN